MAGLAALATAASLGLLAGCGGSSSAPRPTAEQLLRQSAHALARLRTVVVDATFPPGVTYQGFKVQSVNSKVRLPSDSDTTFQVKQQDFLVDVEVIQVAGQAYIKLPFSTFSKLSPAQASQIPNPASLFNPRTGLPAVLPEGRQAKLTGSERIDGHDSWRLSAVYPAAMAGQLLGGVRPLGDVTATLWIGKDDHLIRKAVLAGPLVAAGASSKVTIHLRDFNGKVDITPPS